MAITATQLRKDGLLDVLADLFDEEGQAGMLLDNVEYPTSRRPSFRAGDPLSFWRSVTNEIGKGIIPGGLEGLLQAAASHYPHNEQLKAWASGAAQGETGGGGQATPPQEEDALTLWRQRLAHLQREEAITSDPGKKFELEKRIAEAKAKIDELSRS